MIRFRFIESILSPGVVIFGITALYFISAELTKRWFYQGQNNGC